MSDPPPIDAALATWDRVAAQTDATQAEILRKEIVAKFPLSAWPTLPLERYALGTGSEDSWCWWMEFNSQELGSVRGGAAQKHFIFKRKTGGWYAASRYANEVDAWEAVRAGFVEAFRLASEGRLADIDAIDALEGGQAIRTKSTYIYFPDSLLPIYSAAHIAYFIKLFGGDAGSRGVVAANVYLKELLLAKSEFANWSGHEVMRFIYRWADPRDTQKVLKIAPGEQARFWPECLAGAYISVGWPDVGDLRQYASRDDFHQRFVAIYASTYGRSPSTASKKANEVWKLMELVPGDVVVANKGTAEVVGIGTVIEPGYVWRPELGEYSHTVSVRWDDTAKRSIEPVKSWANATVARVSNDLYDKIRAAGPGVTTAPPAVVPNDLMIEIQSALERRRQVIIYGPPGTGKTRAALEFAKWWLASGEAKQRGVAKSVRRIEQVSFHPSYAYEDFVEGYRPKKDSGVGLVLELRDGVFKDLCRRAALDPAGKYLLIIDEINRGNIPKIFGELITLIEADKRGLKETLPQSGQEFSVPNNLYIIGTMNTADRSIRVLDAALRRRFAFIELMPDATLLEGEGPEGLKLNDLLTELNRRIVKAVGREKQVGHSYFLDAGVPIKDSQEFARVFRQEVMPLLQEFCYDDYSKLADFVGREVVDVELQRVDPEVFDDPARLIEALNKTLLGT